MSFINEFFKSVFRTLGRILAYALIGFIIFLFAQKYVKASNEYWVSIPNYNGSSYSNYVNNWPFTFTENALGTTCTSLSNCTTLRSTDLRLTYVGSDILNTYMYDLVVQFDLEYIMLGSTLVFNEQGITCSFRYSDEIIPCGARLVYEQVEPYNTYFDKYLVHVQINITNVSPSINRSGIAIRIPPIGNLSNSNALARYTYTISEPIFRQNNKDNTDIITGNANANAQNIINAQNENTQNIISSQSYLNGQLIDNNNRNTQSIIDNQNSNTQDTIDAINNANMKCENVNITNSDFINNGQLKADGTIGTSSNYKTTNFIRISENDYTLTKNFVVSNVSGYAYYCLYDYYKTKISCQDFTTASNEITIHNENASFIRIAIRSASSTNEVTFTGQYCYPYQERTNEILTDTSLPSNLNLPNVNFSNPISSLFLLPITFIQSLSSTCSSYSVPFLGGNFSFPCINLGNYLGSTLWGIIDLFITFGMIYSVARLFRKVYLSFTSLNEKVVNEFYGSGGSDE